MPFAQRSGFPFLGHDPFRVKLQPWPVDWLTEFRTLVSDLTTQNASLAQLRSLFLKLYGTYSYLVPVVRYYLGSYPANPVSFLPSELTRLLWMESRHIPCNANA